MEEPKIPLVDKERHIKEFKQKRESYQIYEQFLKEVFNDLIADLGINSIIQVRAKTVKSFAEKLIRKDKYKDPLTEVTDLCGGRIITQLESEMDTVCDFIRSSFDIDLSNSMDKVSVLKEDEFGYRSVHFVVSINRDTIQTRRNPLKFVDVPREIRNLKAEIQVRTLAQHIWADITHDRIYKSSVTIPSEWKREAARVMAMLEQADKVFSNLSNSVTALSHSYDLQYTVDRLKNEETIALNLIDLFTEEGSVSTSLSSVVTGYILDLANLYRINNRNLKAIELLEDKHPDTSDFLLNAKYRIALGRSKCLAGGEDEALYVSGKTMLRKIITEIEQREQSEKGCSKNAEIRALYGYACFVAGNLLARRSEDTKEAFSLLNKAYQCDQQNPFYFITFFDQLIINNLELAFTNISIFKENINACIGQIDALIEAGIDVTSSSFAKARCHLYLGNTSGAVQAMARAVATLLDKEMVVRDALIDAELTKLLQLKNVNPEIAHALIVLLKLAATLKEVPLGNKYGSSVKSHGVRGAEAIRCPLVIIAGGASSVPGELLPAYKPYIEEALLGFTGTVFSGGTTVGVPGLVGEAFEKLRNSGTACSVEAYLPEKLPSDAIKDDRYSKVWMVPSVKYLKTGEEQRFSVLEVLTGWSDVLIHNVEPRKVILLGIGGGEIARMEYIIALALGARVALLANSGGAAREILMDPYWKTRKNLHELPEDPKTVWALVNQPDVENLDQVDDEIKKMAIEVHKVYRRTGLGDLNKIYTSTNQEKKKQQLSDVNTYKPLMEWKNLDDILKRSNISQVLFAGKLLDRMGYKLVKSAVPSTDGESLKKNKVAASLEHARWNAERLLDGWRWGEKKDILAKTNQYIVPWNQLPNFIRKYDFIAIRNWIRIFRKFGYEILKKE